MWLGVAALVALAVLPQLPYFNTTGRQFLLSLVLIYALLGVALTMLLGWGGQVSLGNFALVGLGAYLTARWSSGGWTLMALFLVVGAIGAARDGRSSGCPRCASGASRWRSRRSASPSSPTTGSTTSRGSSENPFAVHRDRRRASASGSAGPSRSSPSTTSRSVVLAVAVLMCAALRRSSPGRLFLAVRDNERASAAFGVSPAAVKLTMLAVSGFFSAVAGVLWADAWRTVSATQFTPDVSVAILAIPVIGGLGSIGGAVAAAVLLYGLTFFLGPEVQGLFGDLGQNLGFSLFLAGAGVVVTVMHFPNGIAGEAQKRWQRYLDRRAAPGRAGREARASTPTLPLRVRGRPRALRRRRRPRRARHRRAPRRDRRAHRHQRRRQDDADERHLRRDPARPGLGAGCSATRSSTSRPTSGPPFGLARSFQDASLFAGLTVRETIQVALAQRHKVGILSAMVAAPWVRGTERRMRRDADDIIARFGLTAWADARTSELSTGTRRICDLAAQVAAEPKLILLDEPTAGVAQREAEAFGPLLRQIRDELDCSVLIVEHDMPLLMGLCDRIYALEAGTVIAEGTPEEIRENPRVVASYLGTDETAITRSGALEPA